MSIVQSKIPKWRPIPPAVSGSTKVVRQDLIQTERNFKSVPSSNVSSPGLMSGSGSSSTFSTETFSTETRASSTFWEPPLTATSGSLEPCLKREWKWRREGILAAMAGGKVREEVSAHSRKWFKHLQRSLFKERNRDIGEWRVHGTDTGVKPVGSLSPVQKTPQIGEWHQGQWLCQFDFRCLSMPSCIRAQVVEVSIPLELTEDVIASTRSDWTLKLKRLNLHWRWPTIDGVPKQVIVGPYRESAAKRLISRTRHSKWKLTWEGLGYRACGCWHRTGQTELSKEIDPRLAIETPFHGSSSRMKSGPAERI